MSRCFSYVRKKDGRLEVFDERKISNTIAKICTESGYSDRETIKKIFQKTLDFLKATYLAGTIINTYEIGDIIERIFGEQKLEHILRIYQKKRVLKDKVKRSLKVSKTKKKSDTTDMSLLVQAEIEEETSPWDKTKIVDALMKEAKLKSHEAYKVACGVEKKLISSGLKKVTTSLIRELVDNELLIQGHQTKIKVQTSLGMPTYDLDNLILSKVNENSNLAANSPEAINLAVSEIILKQYALNNVFSRDVSDAHLDGRIHIHDLGYPTRVYCSSHSLEYLKKYGLHLENLDVISAPARHARTLTGHLNTFLASMQAYYAGALGIGYINIFYAPYLVGFSREQMLQEAQHLIFSLSQSAFSRGGQVLFLDANIHTGIPAYLKNIPAIGPGGKYTGKTYKEYEKEAQEFAMALLEVWRRGDKHGNIFAFPKCDLHINEETFSDPEQRKILEFACEVASENGTPYFIFDRDEVTLSACCRLRTQITDNYMIEHPESMRFCGFQNVTVNLPQAAYRAKRTAKNNVLEKLFSEIASDMDLCVKAHLQKKEFISKLMKEKHAPLYQIGKISFDGRPYVDLQSATYIIGILGLNECVQHLTGKQLHEDEDVFKLGLKIVSFMYLRVKEYEKKYNLKFSLEESPAESATRRLAKIDLQNYPESREVIKGRIDKDEFYYTNSIHFAASAPVSIVERIIKQSQFHPLIESGAIIHAFLGEEKPEPSSIFNLIEKTWRNTKCAQVTISPEFSVCNDCHKMTRGLKDSCVACGSKNVHGITRIVGYYSRISNWNKSKIGELHDRHIGDYSITKCEKANTLEEEGEYKSSKTKQEGIFTAISA